MVYKVENDELSPLDHDQEEEYRLAKAENRQPRCVQCGHPLNVIIQTQYEDLKWTWDEEAKSYSKHDSGDADKPSCYWCGGEDWNLLDEKYYTFF